MRLTRINQALTVLGSAVLLSGLAAFSTASAQSEMVTVVSVEAPAFAAGNLTITGIAEEGGQPAMGVSVFDGVSPDAPYVADVSMGASNNPRGGFLLITDSRALGDGLHILRFDARFADGVTKSTTAQVYVENQQPWEPSDN